MGKASRMHSWSSWLMFCRARRGRRESFGIRRRRGDDIIDVGFTLALFWCDGLFSSPRSVLRSYFFLLSANDPFPHNGVYCNRAVESLCFVNGIMQKM